MVGTYVHDRCRIVHRVRKKANIMLHASNGGKKGGGLGRRVSVRRVGVGWVGKWVGWYVVVVVVG